MGVVKNLGLVKAIQVGTTEPINTNILWFDENIDLHKYFDTTLGIWRVLSANNDALFGNNTILKSDVAGIPLALTIPEDTIIGRKSGDVIDALTPTEVLGVLGITATIPELNFVGGVTSPIQTQIDNLHRIDDFDEVVISGLTAPTSANLTHTIISGVAFINNKRVFTSDTPNTYTASRDTYVDLSGVGTFTFVEVANGADAPSLTANSIRLMIVETDGTAITVVTDVRPLDLRIDKLLGRKMDIPTGVTATLQAGGSLGDGIEFFYVVTATDGTGETIQSTEVSATPAGANRTIKIDWTTVIKARFYNVYRRVSGIYKLFKQVTAPTITLTDDGSVTFVTGSPPLFTNAYRAKLEDIGDVTLEIGSTDITSGTVNRILFEGTGNFLQESANFTWDDSTSTLAVTGDVDVSKHMAIGGSASISSNTILTIKENISSGDSTAIFINTNLTSTDVGAFIVGADYNIAVGGTIGASDVTGISIRATSDVTAGTAPNLTGLSLGLEGSGASPATTRVIEIRSPSFAGGAQPSVYDGINIANQGVSGITTSTALKIQSQTGSTNNYAIITGAGRIGFNQATPLARVHITGEGTTSATFGLIVENSTGVDILNVRDDRVVLLADTATRFINSGHREEQLRDKTLVNGANNNVQADSIVMRLIIGPTATFNITGFSGGVDGRIIKLVNTTGQDMTINNLSGSSDLGKRIITNTGADRTTTGDGVVVLVYDTDADSPNGAWRIVSFDITTKKAIVIASLTRDETHAVATDVSPVSFVVPFGGLFQLPYAEIETAGTTGVVTIDIHKNGTTIFTTKITIDSGELTSRTAATPPVIIGANTFNKFDKFTVDIDAIHTTPGKGLTIYIPIDITDF